MLIGNTAPLGAGLIPTSPKENPLPEVGQTVLLQWNKWANMYEVPEGAPMLPQGTYIEVQVKAIKTAKVILE